MRRLIKLLLLLLLYTHVCFRQRSLYWHCWRSMTVGSVIFSGYPVCQDYPLREMPLLFCYRTTTWMNLDGSNIMFYAAVRGGPKVPNRTWTSLKASKKMTDCVFKEKEHRPHPLHRPYSPLGQLFLHRIQYYSRLQYRSGSRGGGEQGWRHKWNEFDVGSRLYSEGFSPSSPVFLPPQKSAFLNSNSIGNSRAAGLSVEDCCVLPSLNKVILIWFNLFTNIVTRSMYWGGAVGFLSEKDPCCTIIKWGRLDLFIRSFTFLHSSSLTSRVKLAHYRGTPTRKRIGVSSDLNQA